MNLEGAVGVVTGASSGIGRSTALKLAAAGADVVLAARRENLLEEVATLVAQRGRRPLAVPCDVSDLAQVEELQRRTQGSFGRCDVLVNNAGVPGGGPFAELTMEQIERIARTNYLGVLYCTKVFLPMMLAARQGHVVNVASLAGRFAVPGSSVYSSTKHAVVAFSEALYYELGPKGIVVTAVNPGLVATEGFPHRDALEAGRKVMSPDDVARLIVRVVKEGIGPERSLPRWMAALQAFRVLTPPLYRFGLKQVVKRAIRPTRVGER
ncbi:MAG: SDR family NAD(P)-dependent oxidoreductase [Actinomycetota bacterium]